MPTLQHRREMLPKRRDTRRKKGFRKKMHTNDATRSEARYNGSRNGI
jgi:hypothetical protein